MKEKQTDSVIEIENDAFLITPRDLALNPDISNNAKALYMIIKSYIGIPNFILYQSTVKKSFKGGRDSFQNAWNELKKLGYLEQNKTHVNGRFRYVYKLLSNVNNNEHLEKLNVNNGLDLPHTDLQPTDFPYTVPPHTVNTPNIISIDSNNIDSNNINNNIPSNTKDSSNLKDSGLIGFEGMKLTDSQYEDLRELILLARSNSYKRPVSKESVISFYKYLFDKHFILPDGKHINDIKAFCISHFNVLKSNNINDICEEQSVSYNDNDIISLDEDELDRLLSSRNLSNSLDDGEDDEDDFDNGKSL